MRNPTDVAKTLLESLPFIKRYYNERIVIKYGGSAQIDSELKKKFAQDIHLLYKVGIKPIIIHGGGKNITNLLNDLNIGTKFVDGQRVTTKEVMRVVEMVLSGEINNEIVSLLNNQCPRGNAKAVGISGKDANFLEATYKDFEKFGYTGTITKINSQIVDNIIEDSFIPVISPIASSPNLDHVGFNINADLAASRIAVALKARKILFLTDTRGILDENTDLISELDIQKVEQLKKDGVISGGMIPKVNACIESLKGGVSKAHIIDGRIEHSLLLEVLTSGGIGTNIKL